MAKEEEQKDANKAPSFQISAQYIKDLSFENPHAPHSLFSADQKQTIDVAVDLKAQKLQDGVYEVTLHLTVRAFTKENSVFLVDLTYAGIFQISNIPTENMERVLMIDCPFIMFPYARRVVSDITRDGGFPPLTLEPIDFNQLYAQNMRRNAEGAKS